MNEICALSALPLGESAFVTEISPRSSMAERLLDLGLIPGTRVVCVAESPAGDPRAYLMRGAVIALRRCDSAAVAVSPLAQPAPLREAVAV